MSNQTSNLKDLAAVSKALGDEGRLRLLMALGQGELCLCQLIELLDLAPSTVSRHMGVLAQAGLVEMRKQGRWHYYRLSPAPTAVAVLGWVRPALAGDPVVRQDRAALRKVQKRDLAELSACYRG